MITKSPLANADLLREQAWLNGEWVDADSGETFPVTNPATGEELAHVPRMGAAETRRALEAAEAAFPGWRGRTAADRARTMRRWADLMLEHLDDLALLLTLEQGKPLAESEAEIRYAASFLEWFGEEGKRVYGDTIPSPLPDRRLLVLKQPVGVAAGITPWNFPSAMPTRKAAPALAEEAGLPRGVFSVVTGDAEDAPAIGGEMTSSPLVRKVGFTGSTEVGKLLMAQCAKGLKKISLELGGNAPFVVFDDADLDEAVAGTVVCKFRNSGQTCISANRILVQEGIYDAYLERLVEAVVGLKVGAGTEPDVRIGPLIEDAALDKVTRHVANAVEGGAELHVGGE